MRDAGVGGPFPVVGRADRPRGPDVRGVRGRGHRRDRTDRHLRRRAAGCVTGWLEDASGSYVLPMSVVGGLMLVSAVLGVVLARRGEVDRSEPVDAQYAL